jgi:hypothetical protein
VQGVAIGGGTTMLAHCDFVYAGESAKFQLPFVDLALVPEFGSSLLLPLRFGYVRAAELMLLGRPFDALRAAELGLVTQVVPDWSLLAVATQTAEHLAQKPPRALQACKRLLRRALREQLEQAVKFENAEFAGARELGRSERGVHGVLRQTSGTRRHEGATIMESKLFFLDLSAGRVIAMNPDGSDRKTIAEGRMRLPDGIDVDVDAGHLYWTNMGNPSVNDGWIERADLDGAIGR